MPTVKRCNWVNQNGVQCGLPFGHIGGHGNGALTTMRDDWHEYMGPVAVDANFPKVEKFGVVWTETSTQPRCYWMGVTGRCVYERGHTLPHKEDHGDTLL
jgi:hypothetical protein